jgi:hypothetical protein
MTARQLVVDAQIYIYASWGHPVLDDGPLTEREENLRKGSERLLQTIAARSSDHLKVVLSDDLWREVTRPRRRSAAKQTPNETDWSAQHPSLRQLAAWVSEGRAETREVPTPDWLSEAIVKFGKQSRRQLERDSHLTALALSTDNRLITGEKATRLPAHLVGLCKHEPKLRTLLVAHLYHHKGESRVVEESLSWVEHGTPDEVDFRIHPSRKFV